MNLMKHVGSFSAWPHSLFQVVGFGPWKEKDCLSHSANSIHVLIISEIERLPQGGNLILLTETKHF